MGTGEFGRIEVQLNQAGVLCADRKSTRLNSSHTVISYAVFCLKKKKNKNQNKPAGKKSQMTSTVKNGNQYIY